MGLVDLYYGWFEIAIIAFGIVIGLIALIYMLGSMLMNDRMKTWAKMELTEMFYSAVILAVAIPGLTLIDSVVQGSLGVTNQGAVISSPVPGQPTTSLTTTYIAVTQSNAVGINKKVYRFLDICDPGTEALVPYLRNIPSCHLKLGIWYMNEMFDEAKNYAYDIYLSYIWTSMASEFTINMEYVFEKSGFFNFNPWRGFFTTGNTIKALLFDWALKVMMLLKFQEALLRFIGVALFPTFYVMGAILRAFTFTRRLGGLLLGIAISLFFIFPAFYAFGALIVIELKLSAAPAWAASASWNPLAQDVSDPPIGNFVYSSGSFPMVGGATGAFSTEDAHQALTGMEGMTDSDYLLAMEQGGTSQSTPFMPSFDLNNKDAAPKDQASYLKAWNIYSTWFTNALKKGRADNFVTLTFTDGGFIDSLARITFWATFFSLLSIIGTIAAVRSLSITFGGDIEIAGLTRLI